MFSRLRKSKANELLDKSDEEYIRRSKREGFKDKTLLLRNSEINDHQIPTLCNLIQDPQGMIRSINMTGNIISSSGFSHFLQFFQHNTYIEELNFGDNNIGDGSMADLGTFLSVNRTIKIICCGKNITDEGIRVLNLSLVQNNSLIELNLGGCAGISSRSVPALTEIVSKTHIYRLAFPFYRYTHEVKGLQRKLSVNKAKADGNHWEIISENVYDYPFQEMCQVVHSKEIRLESIALINCGLTSELASLLFKSLKQAFKLKSINLSRNVLNDYCMFDLVDTFQAATEIKILALNGNNITDCGVEALLQIFNHDNQLQHLDLSGNKEITDNSAEFLCALVGGSYLSYVDMADTGVNSGLLYQLQRELSNPIEQRQTPNLSITKSASKI